MNGDDAPGALVLSGGGTTMVSTDALLAQAARLALLRADARDWQARLERIRALEALPAPAWSAEDPGLAVFAARQTIDAVEARSGELAESLVVAAEAYGQADRTAAMLARMTGAWLGHSLGRLAPLVFAAAIPAATAGAVAWLLGGLLRRDAPGTARSRGPGTARSPGPDVAGLWIGDPRLLANPAVVALVRVLVSSVDDVAAGAVGVPFPVSAALGDEGAGLFGVTTTAAGTLAVARSIGMLRETPVTVTRVGKPRPARPPGGFADLAARIPRVSTGGPQVRIERYGGAADAAWLVYIGGTAEWSPVSAGEPWDMTSNITAVAEQGAGSYRAVVQAMHEAGIRPTDAVIPVGHSQGGLVAAQLAAAGEFNTVAVATFGAPVAKVPVPPGLPVIAVEHSEDLVPALGGAARDAAARLTVSRELYADAAVPASPLPAHGLVTYRETARMIDASPAPALADFRTLLAATVGTAPGVASRWRGTRSGSSGAQ
ncbi:hypothetical protein SAMN05216282_105185 [Cryobacterium psychrotolerans]|uniref:Alpha/beta hydrolase n=1 Tax=Cryobacterium psychrotolerans TaxID=386301 RepID=A0A1G9BH88_9MICO|nr:MULTISPECIES: hypothetical protein [Cryobacterium]TFD46220.1 hypothetical protein E3T33_05345 [Cryobacterium sp. TMT1-2-1]TFD84747.1 hypothetical protein E3T56_09870 [Cryobacterium psychrotolerans]SDK38888.1 hypothetical protein SAMN05216282_105185 [Cryobacterium psychrotolerans]